MKLDTIENEETYKDNRNVTKTVPKKRGYGLDQYYEEERIANQIREAKRKKKKKKKKIILCFKILLVLIVLGILFLFLFFKTTLFQKYKEIWVQTAMTTMNHQYLATWFLSNEEIEEIMKKLERIGYIAINTKTQIITPTVKGEKIYDVVYQSMPDMLNPKLTASWEKGLDMVSKREIQPDEFMGKLEAYINSKIDKLVIKR